MRRETFMSAEQQGKAWGKIVARAWQDAGFKRRLLADPAAVLKEHGVAVPAGVQVQVLEDTEAVRNLVLPSKPGGELAEADLEQVAAGARPTIEIG